MVRGKIRHLFPGGNTSKGFHSYYDYILPQKQAESIFIIKGGPGTGKSTFMMKTGLEMSKEGYDVEFLHCSSDPDSLDGIVLPALGTAIIDGTAPHVVDPKNPGAVDTIINLGEYWDREGMGKSRDAILRENAEVGRLFKRAYRYLEAAACVHDDNTDICSRAINSQKVAEATSGIIDELFGKDEIAEREGGLRKLFATAITPQGLRSFISSAADTERVIVLKGEAGTGTEKLLEKVMHAALEKGFYVEAFYCALLPEKLEHLVIPGKGLAIATSNKYHTVISSGREVIDLNEYLDKDVIEGNRDVMEYNRLEFESLLNRATATIGQAKNVHDHMERYYISNMDFAAIDKCRMETVSRIKNIALSV